MFKLFSTLFMMMVWGQLLAQSNHYPIKIEEKTEKYTETSSKYGSHERTKKTLYIIYNDNSAEVASKHRLEEIFKSVPLAKKEYQRYKTNNLYKITSLPLFAVGFWGGVNALNNKNKEQNTLLAAAGLLSGATIFEVFDYRKKRNINRMIAYCNNYWKSNNPQSDLIEQILPDVLKIGVINDNTVGIGVTWNIGE